MAGKTKHIGCLVPNCMNLHRSLGYCDKHYQLYRKYGDTQTRIRPVGSKKPTSNGYIQILNKLEHIIVAERALGKPLPKRAQVHHVNRIKTDNRPENLVVCPDDAYHRIIEMRTLAYETTGHANWRRCVICKQYDDPSNMFLDKSTGTALHRECRRIYENKRYHDKKSVEALEACGNPDYRKCPYCDKWDDPKDFHFGHHLECFSASLTKNWTDERKDRTRNVKVIIEGNEYSVAALAIKYGIKRDTILARANRGLPFSKVTAKL